MPPASATEIATYKEDIYKQCLEDPEAMYYQHDLQAMGVIPNGDVTDLIRVVQALIDEKYFKVLQDNNQIGYKCRPREEVKIHQSLSDDEAMVYTLIDEAGAEGVWTRMLKNKTRLHDSVIKGIFKSLEKKKLISDFKTMEHPGKTYYIKASIRPTERASGGPWYTDNEFDEEMIIALSNTLAFHVEKHSHPNPQKISKHTKRAQVKHIEEIKALRAKAFAPRFEVEPEDEEYSRKKLENDTKYPFPTSYKNYVTSHECALWIMEGGYTNGVTLTAEDVQQLLDVLCWDGRIEKVNSPAGIAYKSIRKSNDELTDNGPANGFTEAPCGRCPVFDLCEEGGPVGPSNCEYFNQWLDF